MTVNEFVCDGIDKLMADAAAHAAGFTDASGALVIGFLDAADTLRNAWRDWLEQKVQEEVKR